MTTNVLRFFKRASMTGDFFIFLLFKFQINKLVDGADFKILTPRIEDIGKCNENPTECGYPTEHLMKLFSENKIKKELFVNDVMKSGAGAHQLEFESYGGRKPFCPSEHLLIFPKYGRNHAGHTRIIVQLPDKNITQGIRTESCYKDETYSHCQLLKDFGRVGHAVCAQKIMLRHTQVVEDNGDITEDLIETDSCCVCVYRPKRA